ncbi:interleukin-17 receptor C isoform X2 [Hemicordylus capensis]|uniref:interleukin-17 receptor C isoform X2 n=1 Tax=Hemicordylus capensis TaxID=884348 RepID=UPI002303D878|nr:interleukin-17 receptor C isoform X2 [Hemicordylus capensis]
MTPEPLSGSQFTPDMWILSLALILVHLPSTCFQPATFPDSVSCSQNLGCRLLERDVVCTPGEAMPAPQQLPRGWPSAPTLQLTQLKTSTTLQCKHEQDCLPCVQVTLQLGLLEFRRTHVLLSAQTYASSRCVAVEIWLPHTHDWVNSTLGSLQFDCFPVALSGELHVTAFIRSLYQSTPVLKDTHYGPNCTWLKAKAIRLCQVPRLEIFVKPEEVVLQVLDFPVGQHFDLWLYLNQTREPKGLGDPRLLTQPENVSIPVSQVFSCLCLQVWTKVKDSPRTYLCPFENDAAALARVWAQSRLELNVFGGTLSCSFSSPCDLPGELVPCWSGGLSACHPLHPKLRLALISHEPQEFPGLTPHPNICVQVKSNGRTYRQRCLQDDPVEKLLLLWKTQDSQGNPSFRVLEQDTWVPIAQAASTRNGFLEEALQNDLQSGECSQVWHGKDNEAGKIWACSLEKYCRTHWVLVWMVTLLSVCSLLFVLLLKKEALKGWLRLLKEDYGSRGALLGRHVLILYSPDHAGFEHLVSSLAAALTQLQLAVSLELWSRGKLGSLGPMQWLHAQRQQVLQEGGSIVLLFSPGAVASCAEWLGWEEKGTLSHIDPNSTFLASLNCVLPDFLAGKAKDRYVVACFEELLHVDKIPALFRSVPVYPLPSQVFSFLLALAGPRVGHEQRSRLRRHAVWISKSLERAVQECQKKDTS